MHSHREEACDHRSVDSAVSISFEQLKGFPKRTIETVFVCSGGETTHLWTNGLDHTASMGSRKTISVKDSPVARLKEGHASRLLEYRS
jgi:hypothetical protein